ncbi:MULTISPECIES: putative leader peptide [unclassified Streptomyces]|uniref:Leader peptide n=1 Tax=Streptomyces niveiscabiei TaxID=164115 RepID=A0ABW9HPX8_9ACTN|nr:putative leader peptide [Streptomyces sp. ST1015]
MSDEAGLCPERRATLSTMSGTGIALVSRRHVDLCRMSSAICPAS